MVMIQKLRQPYTLIIIRISIIITLLASLLLSQIGVNVVSAAPAISITSPTANQQIPGTNFTVTGTASPNTTVVVSNNGLSFAQTKSDGTGNWTVNSSLPAGEVKITAKAIENPDYAYFVTTQDLFSNPTYNINRLRLSDNVINPGGGIWPINATTPAPLFLIPSPTQNIFYSGNYLNPAALPSKFNTAQPAAPVAVTGAYPSDPQTNKGDFSSDGLRYFAANLQAGNVSVVNSDTNEFIKNISFGPGEIPVTVWRSPQGNMHVTTTGSSSVQYVLNSTNGDIIRIIPSGCTTPGDSPTVTFSQDINYPYYYMPCGVDKVFIKRRISDDTVVATINVDGTNGALSLDNKKLFIGGSVGSDPVVASKMIVVNTETNTKTDTINLNAAASGFLATSDFQKIYVATPGSSLDTQNIDVIDTRNYSVTQLATQGAAWPITTSPTDVSSADVDVTFVLGATSTAANASPSKLAETGVIIISTAALLATLSAALIYLYIDYRRHKKPLSAIDPSVNYSFAHHIKVVTIPVFKYRLMVSLSRNKPSKRYTR
jgi:hypothetical protein